MDPHSLPCPPIRWSTIVRSLYMAGFIKDFSKGECLRIHQLLDEREAAGLIKHITTGNPSTYQIVRTGG